jgi:hypothetical protein
MAEPARRLVAIDHAKLDRLDAVSAWADWRAALDAMGVRGALLDPRWPEPFRVLARERLVPDGVDRWLAARIAVVLGTIAICAGLHEALFQLALPWAEPTAGDALIDGRHGDVVLVHTVTAFGGLSGRGFAVVLGFFGAELAIPAVAYGLLRSLRPSLASSQKTLHLVDAANALRSKDFVASFDGIEVHNLPTAHWLAGVGAARRKLRDGIGKIPKESRDELGNAVERMSRAVDAAETGFAKGLAASVAAIQAGGVSSPVLDLAALNEAISEVDAIAERVDPWRRVLPRIPARRPRTSSGIDPG